MITIVHDEMHRKITVTGHAGSAPVGQDIVCASVSVLTSTLLASIFELSEAEVSCEMRKGYTYIQYGHLDDNLPLQVLIRAFFIGIEGIAEEYPDYIEVQAVEDGKNYGEEAYRRHCPRKVFP